MGSIGLLIRAAGWLDDHPKCAFVLFILLTILLILFMRWAFDGAFGGVQLDQMDWGVIP